MSEQIDFSTVSLRDVRDNPQVIYDIGKGLEPDDIGVLPEIAEAFQAELSEIPDAQNLGQLVGAVGPAKTLRDNETGVETTLAKAPIEISRDWVVRSGIMRPLDRGLWDAETPAPADSVKIGQGAVMNWQDRFATVMESVAPSEVVLISGNRRMDTKTEIREANIGIFRLETGRVPTEAEYAERFIAPRLRKVGHTVTELAFNTKDGAEIIRGMFEEKPELLERQLTAVRVANAGLPLALQIRRVAREIKPDFDDEANPQMFAMTDEIHLAENKAETKDAKNNQSPVSALRQAVVVAKELIDQTF